MLAALPSLSATSSVLSPGPVMKSSPSHGEGSLHSVNLYITKLRRLDAAGTVGASIHIRRPVILSPVSSRCWRQCRLLIGCALNTPSSNSFPFSVFCILRSRCRSLVSTLPDLVAVFCFLRSTPFIVISRGLMNHTYKMGASPAICSYLGRHRRRHHQLFTVDPL